MHALTLRHHPSKSTSVWQHFILSTYGCWSAHIGWHHVLLLFLRSMEILILGLNLLAVLLALDIYWRLGSNSVFRWCRAWFLRISSMLFHHLLIHAMTLGASVGDTATHEIIMLLYQAKWVRWGSVMVTAVHHVLTVGQSLSVWTRWSFLSSARPETCSITLIRANASSTSRLVCFLGSMTSSGHLSATDHLSRAWLHSSAVVVIHLVLEWSRSHWAACLENTKLLV